MQSKEIRFMSCFICEVIINDESIELIDSGHHSFFIDKSNDELMKSFKDWFKSVYKACIPQTLTVVQYEINSKDDEMFMLVKNLIYKKNDCTTVMLNENGDNRQ